MGPGDLDTDEGEEKAPREAEEMLPGLQRRRGCAQLLLPFYTETVRSRWFLFFQGRTPRHVEFLRPGVPLELQLPASTAAPATPRPYPTERGQGSNPKPCGS